MWVASDNLNLPFTSGIRIPQYWHPAVLGLGNHATLLLKIHQSCKLTNIFVIQTGYGRYDLLPPKYDIFDFFISYYKYMHTFSFDEVEAFSHFEAS
jgi:hypothetical protein